MQGGEKKRNEILQLAVLEAGLFKNQLNLFVETLFLNFIFTLTCILRLISPFWMKLILAWILMHSGKLLQLWTGLKTQKQLHWWWHITRQVALSIRRCDHWLVNWHACNPYCESHPPVHQTIHTDCLLVQRLLNYITPDQVHVMEAGKIIYSGSIDVARVLEQDGYEGVQKLIEEGAVSAAS